MASPQLENGYTRLANQLFEAVIRSGFTARMFRIVLLVLRETYGVGGRQLAPLSFDYVAMRTGLLRRHVIETMMQLERAGVLQVSRRPAPAVNLWGIVKDYERWDFSGSAQISHPPCAKTVTISSAQNGHQEQCPTWAPMKETTKETMKETTPPSPPGALEALAEGEDEGWVGGFFAGAQGETNPAKVSAANEASPQAKASEGVSAAAVADGTASLEKEQAHANGGLFLVPPAAAVPSDQPPTDPTSQPAWLAAVVVYLVKAWGWVILPKHQASIPGAAAALCHQHGLELARKAYCQALRQVAFERHYDNRVKYPACLLEKRAPDCLDSLKIRRHENDKLRHLGRQTGYLREWVYEPPASWSKRPPELEQDFWLSRTPLGDPEPVPFLPEEPPEEAAPAPFDLAALSAEDREALLAESRRRARKLVPKAAQDDDCPILRSCMLELVKEQPNIWATLRTRRAATGVAGA